MNETTAAIYNFLVAYIAAHHRGPTLREIGAGVGIVSPSSVIPHLESLAGAGLITYERGISRGISLVPQLG